MGKFIWLMLMDAGKVCKHTGRVFRPFNELFFSLFYKRGKNSMNSMH